MPRLSRKESNALTREKLIASARLAFARNGYGATSVDQIAAGADFSKGAFYSNFESKEDILLEVLRVHMTQELAEIRAIVEQSSDQSGLQQRFERWIQAFHQDADWSLLAVELAVHARRNTSFAAAYDKMQAAHHRVLGDLIVLMFARAGLRPPADAADMATAFKALAYGLSLQNRRQGAAESRRGSVKILRLVMDAFKTSAEKAG